MCPQTWPLATQAKIKQSFQCVYDLSKIKIAYLAIDHSKPKPSDRFLTNNDQQKYYLPSVPHLSCVRG